MGWFSNLFSGSVGTLVEQVGGVVDKFTLSGEEKQEFKLKMTALIQQRDSEIEQTIRKQLEAKERVLTAELTQGDSYTKRARPTVVYAGLVFIFLNHVFMPIIAQLFSIQGMTSLDLPVEFWAGWSGIVATWSIGRSFEKTGASNAFSRTVTGNKKQTRLLDDDEIMG